MEKLLPKNWIETSIEKVLTFSYGKGIPITTLVDTGYDVYGANGIIGKYPSYVFEESKVIISCRGAASGTIHKTKPQSIVTSNSIILNEILAGTININYLKYMMTFIDKSDIISGTAQPQITIQQLNKLEILLAPLGEQKSIADKLDNLFSQLDTIKKVIDRVPKLIKDFRQQILTSAVTGKLTEDWRKDNICEDVEGMVLKIKKRRLFESQKNKTVIEKIKGIYIDNKSSLDFDVPLTWRHVNLDKLCSSFSYGTSAKSANIGDYPVVRMGNIQIGKIDWKDLKYTSDELEFKKYRLQIGDVLFNRTNSPELVGKAAIFNSDKDACYAGYLIKISSYSELDSHYLNMVLNSQYAKRWCRENKTDGVSQSNINAQKLSKLTLPFTGILEQKEIVKRVQILFDKIDIIDLRYKQLKKKINNLPLSILHKAFNGELVEQLPTDGNAAALLKEIEELRKTIKKK